MQHPLMRAPLPRRTWLAAAAASLLVPPWAHAAPTAATPQLAAAWDRDDGTHEAGVLHAVQGRWQVQRSIAVPTRAHGLLRRPGGELLVVARRPGDWLLRWHPQRGTASWHWIDPDRAFNGHVLASVDGKRIFTTETDLETGDGLVGVRDARTLEKIDEWRSGGMDPHELLLAADGSLLVANGGIPTLPETGRLKIGLERMDASLARLDARDGALRGQWRLADRRLSVRHLAWGAHAGRRVLGVALQAEHEDAAARRGAPLLALFDGRGLQPVPAPQPLGGYGGAIAFGAQGFAVGCPRAGGAAVFDGDGRWRGFVPLAEACAVAAAASDGGLWIAGRDGVATWSRDGAPRAAPLAALRLDNHWLAL